VIQSFNSRETEELFHYQHSKRFRSIERVAIRKLLQLHAATRRYEFWRRRPEISWKLYEAIATDSIRFGSTINGESVLSGVMVIATKWKSSIITRDLICATITQRGPEKDEQS
jgi:plasmid maintenance system killer protein